jgi:Domain of unknown function DUF29
MSLKATRYDTDFYAWTQEQAARLRLGAVQDLDLIHLAEEMESLGKREQRELYNRLRRLLRHLLKLHVAAQRLPRDLERAGRGWRTTVKVQRVELAKLLRENRTLWPRVPDELTDAYTVACIEAAGDLRLDEAALPSTCPWDQHQVLDPDFWPDAPQDSDPASRL